VFSEHPFPTLRVLRVRVEELKKGLLKKYLNNQFVRIKTLNYFIILFLLFTIYYLLFIILKWRQKDSNFYSVSASNRD
jgi:hypothetical protein